MNNRRHSDTADKHDEDKVRLRQQNDYLTSLHETALAIMNRLEVTELLEAIIERACSLIGAADGYIYLPNETGDRMSVRIVTGNQFNAVTGFSIRCGEGLAGRIWHSGLPMLVDDYSTWDGRIRRLANNQDIHALLGVPMKSDQRVIGIIGVAHFERDKTFSNDDMVILGQFAELASIALDNARLYTAAQQELAERIQADEALRKSEQRYRALFDHTTDGVSIFDPQGRTIAVNQRIVEMLGYSHDELANSSIMTHVAPSEMDHANDKMDALLRGEGLPPYERTFIAKDGREVLTELSVTLVRDELGRPLHIQSLVRDITQRRRTERRLEAQYAVTRALADADSLSEAGFQLLQALGSTLGWSLGAIWLVDQARDALECLELWVKPGLKGSSFIEFCLHHSFAPNQGLPGMVLAQRAAVWARDIASMDLPRLGVLNELGMCCAFAFPVHIGGDIVGVVEFFSSQLHERDDDLLQMFISVGSQLGQFVERKQAEEQLLMLGSAIRSSSEPMVITSTVGANGEPPIVLYANEAYYRVTGRNPREIVGKPSTVLRSMNIDGEVAERISVAMHSGLPTRFEAIGQRLDGTPFWAEYNLEPITDEYGNCVQWVTVQHDITEHKQYEQQLLYLSTHDYLTDLPNRRALEERLAAVVAHARPGDDNALMFIDLDNFKVINDATPLGHDAGDQALKFLAQLLNRRLRDDDMLARLGGDEFAVLLEHTTIARAEQIARRLSSAAVRQPFSIAGQIFPITLSIGLVAISAQDSPRTVLFQADTAMYIAKKQGGNRVIVYQQAD